jgi:hypothetical protein
LNRQERRKKEKLDEWIKSLPSDKIRTIEQYSKELSRIDIEVYSYAYERVLRVKFFEMLGSELEAEKLLEEVIEGVVAEGIKIQELLKEGEIYDMIIKKNTEEIIKVYEEMKIKNIKEKDIVKDLGVKYPKMTITAIKNIIVEYKRDKKAREEIVDVKTGLEYIFGKDPEEELNDGDEENIEEEIDMCIEESGKKLVVKEEAKSKLRIKKAEIVGEFGEYIIGAEGVKVGDKIFRTPNDLEVYRTEELKKFYAALGEIAEVMKMC